MTENEWLVKFKAEYLRRTGITFENGGGTNEEAISRYFPNYDPVDAVLHQIEKYGLDDITDNFGWGAI